MKFSYEEFIKTLEQYGIASTEVLENLLIKSQDTGVDLLKLLVEENLISEADLGKLVADQLNWPFVVLSQLVIDGKVLQIIPEIVAKNNKVIAFKKDKEGLHVATCDFQNEQILSFIEKKTGEPVIVHYATEKDISDALNNYTKDITLAYQKILDENISTAKKTEKNELSIIKIVDTTVSYAYKNKSSDIHIEPYEDKSLIRFRIDGILHDIVTLPKGIQEQVVTRIKVMAKLRTDEHQTPQDGKISYKLEDGTIDIRVSIIPITAGEKVVMRLLSDKSRQYSLSDLGLSQSDAKKLADSYNKPHGMILATGPTGSGKTTTLYAILKILNKRSVNIMTIEDPVEYEIEGINHVQVNEKTNLTFASGLKSLVRQDPDIMLVGEIRDTETAGISVNSALTGHLVLSTLHTNDAATSIPRLLDLGVEPFLISSTVNVIIAQRLVRKICVKCRLSRELDIEKDNFSDQLSQNMDLSTLKPLFKRFAKGTKISVYKGKGCDVCHDTGYVGRIGIFEVLLVNDEIKKAINEKKNASDIAKIAVKNGMTTMFEDGFEKMISGVTTLEEILRVTKQ